MVFDSVSSLIDMGGHGVYVWTAYGIGLLVILYNIGVPLLRQQQVIRSIQIHGRRTKHSRRTKKVITTSGRPVQTDSSTNKGEVL
ncbi:heme exporter protein CcmD [Endozoicomonas lisbonensis]|uniref:Heme exporter protein D n=1 Tax=Endozoicomonas lisbonensis TaxID=3120522 RepID=A0ABV2SDQ5_9GAMM